MIYQEFFGHEEFSFIIKDFTSLLFEKLDDDLLMYMFGAIFLLEIRHSLFFMSY